MSALIIDSFLLALPALEYRPLRGKKLHVKHPHESRRLIWKEGEDRRAFIVSPSGEVRWGFTRTPNHSVTLKLRG